MVVPLWRTHHDRFRDSARRHSPLRTAIPGLVSRRPRLCFSLRYRGTRPYRQPGRTGAIELFLCPCHGGPGVLRPRHPDRLISPTWRCSANARAPLLNHGGHVNKHQNGSEQTALGAGLSPVEMKLEVVVLPVADVERAKRFYGRIGWRLDADFANG